MKFFAHDWQISAILTFLFVFFGFSGCGKTGATQPSASEIAIPAEGTKPPTPDGRELLPEISAASGQVLLSLDTSVDASSVSGYVVGKKDLLKIERAKSGEFIINNIPAGTHDIIVTATSAVASLVDTFLLNPEKVPDVGVRLSKVEVLNGLRTKKERLKLPALVSVSGVVTLSVQSDHAGILVYIPGTEYSARTADDGSFSMTVPSGIHNFYFEKDGYHKGQLEEILVDSDSKKELDSIQLHLSTGADGKILLAGGSSDFGNREIQVTLIPDANTVLYMLSESPTFQNSSWKPIKTSSLTYSFLGDGVRTLYVKYSDANGLESAPRSASIMIDTSPPTGTLAIQNGVQYVNSRAVALVFNAIDLTQIAEMLVSNDSSFSNSMWQAYAPSSSWNLTAGDGQKTVYAKLKDKWGKESVVISSSIGLDTSDPVSPSITVPNGLYTAIRTVTLALSASSVFAPITHMIISESPNFTGAVAQGFETSFNFQLSSGDEIKTIYAKFIDAAGNISSAASMVVTLDTTPPSAPILTNVSRRTIGTTETIIFTSTSNDANFDTYEARGGQYTEWTSVTIPISFNLGSDDVWYDLQVRGKDHAGLNGEPAKIQIYKGSKTKLSTLDFSKDQTLSLDYSPYYLDENVTINGGNVLVQPGVLITAKQDNGFGGGSATLTIRSGLLTINGTSSNPVVMRRDNMGAELGWGGILLHSVDGKPRLSASYLDIEGGGSGLSGSGCIRIELPYPRTVAQKPQVTLNDSNIHNCIDTNSQKVGLSIYGSTPQNLPDLLVDVNIANSTFNNLKWAIQIVNAAPNILISNTIFNNTENGFAAIDINNVLGSITATANNFIGTSSAKLTCQSSQSILNFTDNYWNYGSSGAGKTDLGIYGTDSDKCTWSPYRTAPVGGAGPR